MALIRSILYYLLFVLTIIPVGTVMMVGRLFLSESQRYAIGECWASWIIRALRLICGVKWRVQGLENLPKDGTKVIVLCKHQSAWETLALTGVLQKKLVFVFKKELLRIPFFGWALGSVDMIHIDRSAKTEAMAKIAHQGTRLMNEGRWILMFPEGTRVPPGEHVRYKSGGVRMAQDMQADIVPIALNSAKCWPKNSFIKKAGTIDVVVGPLIHSEGKGQRDLLREVENWIEGQMQIIDAQKDLGSSATETPEP